MKREDTMAERDPLEIYLNDHLAAATAACDLTDQLAKESQGEPFGEFLARIHKEIEADRRTLIDVTAQLGIEPDPVKQLTAKVGELLSRVKLGGGKRDAHRLLALETLSLGIEGKACLWIALDAIHGDYGQLHIFDFAALLDRARNQRADVEKERIAAAVSTIGNRATV
jgi:hypothetical protein